jgi:hypothetical protein
VVRTCYRRDRARIEVEDQGRFLVLRVVVGDRGGAVSLNAVDARAVARGLLGGAALAEVESAEDLAESAEA